MHPGAQLRDSTGVLHCCGAFSHPWVPRGPGYLSSMDSTACCFPSCAISHHLPSLIACHLPSCSLQLHGISCLQLFPTVSHIPSPATHHLLPPVPCHLPSHAIPHHVPSPITCYPPSCAISHHLPCLITSHLPPCAIPTSCHHLHLPRSSPRHTHSPVALPPLSPSQNHGSLEKLIGNKQQTPNHAWRDAAPHWKFQPGGQADHKKPTHSFPSACLSWLIAGAWPRGVPWGSLSLPGCCTQARG